MRKFYKAVILLLFISLVAYAAVLNISSTGVWTDTGIWDGGVLPGVTDDVTMSNTVDVTVESGDNITVVSLDAANNNTITIDLGGALTLNKTGFDALIAGNNIVINVDGDLTVNGNVVINNNLVFNVTGTLLINGNIDMKNNAQLDVAAGGAVTVDGNFTAGTNADVTVDGTMDVTGNINTGNGSTLDGGGVVTAGSCTGEPLFCSGGPLPIDLLYFEGITAENQIKLEWASASEINFDYYTIEKSTDAIVFDKLTEIKGEGDTEQTHTYSFVDEVPVMGLNFYRLKATDIDGSFKYHKIIAINYDREQVNDFRMYPNPTFNGEITVRPTFTVQDGFIEVYDSFGNTVFRTNMNSLARTIQLPYDLKSGVYHLKVRDRDEVVTRRFVLIK